MNVAKAEEARPANGSVLARPVPAPVEKKLRLAQLVESRTNPRRKFDEERLKELAESIRQFGILQPILVRPFPILARPEDAAHGKTHEVIAGARRFRAAAIARLEEVPVRIIELDDAAMLEIQLIENLQREDVHPLEEAEAYAGLLKLDGHTVESIAGKVGKDRSYIYRRLSLARLIEPVKAALMDGRLPVQLAIEIARVHGEASQAKAFEECFPRQWKGGREVHDTAGIAEVTQAQLSRFVREEILLELSSAPWRKDDGDLLPEAGPCNRCEKRSGAPNNLGLFGDVPKKNDCCLDPGCFARKRSAFVKITIEQSAAAGEPLVPVSSDYLDPEEEKELGVPGRHSYRQIHDAKGRCANAEHGVIAHGADRMGSQIVICRAPQCPKHGAHGQSPSRAEKTPAQIWADKRKRLEERIEVDVRHELLRQVANGGSLKASKIAGSDESLLRFLGEWVITRAGHDGRREFRAALGIDEKDSWGAEHKKLTALFEGAIAKGRGLSLLVAFASASPFGQTAGLDRAAKLSGIAEKNVRQRISGTLISAFNERKEKALAAAKKAAPRAGQK